MAIKTGLTNTLDLLRGVVNQKDIKTSKRSSYTIPQNSLTYNDRDKVIRHVANTLRGQVAQAPTDVFSYIRHAVQSAGYIRQDNLRIFDMVPELKQAAKILVPSILAPNDLRNNTLTFDVATTRLTQEKKDAIVKIITEHFLTDYELDKKLPEWIKDAYYISGSKPLITIPVSELQKRFNDPNAILRKGVQSSVPSSDPVNIKSVTEQIAMESVFGISDYAYTDDQKKAGITACVESVGRTVTEHLAELAAADGKSYDRTSSIEDKSKQRLSVLATSILAKESLSIIDNTDVAAADKLLQDKKRREMSAKLQDRYKASVIVGLDPYHDGDNLPDHPLVMEPPTESLIPIFSPGKPSDHLGYFLILDEHGAPVHISNKLQPTLVSEPRANNPYMGFSNLFQAYGYNDMTAMTGQYSHYRTMTSVYREIVETHLKSRLEKVGIRKIALGDNNALYESMLSRYLAARQTRILYVPREMVTYIAFSYNDNGMGRSKLEDMRYILSLRITLMIARMLSNLKNAIDYREVSIKFPDHWTGNPLEHVHNVHKMLVQKSMMSFSHDPMETVHNMTSKSIIIKPSGLPAFDYEINHVQGNRDSGTIDDTFYNDIKDQLVLDTDVPPSALNALSDAEYMRSVVTINLFFSRFVSGLQETLLKHLTEFIKHYTGFSGVLIEKIREVAATGLTEDQKKSDGESGVVVTDLKGKKKRPALDELVDEIIASIKVRLPAPNIAPNKAQFEEFKAFLEIVDQVVNAVVDPAIVGDDQELTQTVDSVKSMFKQDALHKASAAMGLGDIFDIPNIESKTPLDILKQRQYFENARRAIKDLQKAVGRGDAGGFGGGGGGGFDSGGFGGQPEGISGEPGMDDGMMDNTGGGDMSTLPEEEAPGTPTDAPADQTTPEVPM